MTFFEEQLEQGIFQICYCKKCNYTIWPPKEICHKCYDKSDWKKLLNISEWKKKLNIFNKPETKNKDS